MTSRFSNQRTHHSLDYKLDQIMQKNSKLKKISIEVVCFLAFFILVDNIVASCLEKYGNITWGTGSYREIYNIKESVDILFMGSSHTRDGIDLSTFSENNIKAHKLNIPGGPPFHMMHLFDIFLKENPKPGLVVVDLSWNAVKNSLPVETFRYLNPWHAFPVFLEADTGEIGSFFNSLGRTSLFIPYMIKNKEDIKDSSNRPHFTLNKHKRFLSKKYSWFTHNKELDFLTQLIQQTKSLSIPVVIIEIPKYSVPLISLKEVAYTSYLKQKEYYDFINNLALNNDIPFIRFNTGESLLFRSDPLMFGDLDHLHSYGSKLFSRILIDCLNKLKIEGFHYQG